MAKFIKTLVDRINLLNRKGLSPYYSPLQIGEDVHSASLNLWKKYIQEFERTQLISVYLEPLRGKESVTLTNGAGTLVASKGQYKTAVMLSSDIKVEQVDIGHWSDRINHSVKTPTATYPVCRIDNVDIVVRPVSVPSVIVHFLKTPTKPVYAYTTSGDDYVYDDANSVDFEWPAQLHDEIVDRVLGNLGISQREPQLVQFSNLEQQKEGR